MNSYISCTPFVNVQTSRYRDNRTMTSSGFTMYVAQMDIRHLIIPLHVRFDKIFFQVSPKRLLAVQTMAQLLHCLELLELKIQTRIADRTVCACAGWSCSRGFNHSNSLLGLRLHPAQGKFCTRYFCLGHGKVYRPMKKTTRL